MSSPRFPNFPNAKDVEEVVSQWSDNLDNGPKPNSAQMEWETAEKEADRLVTEADRLEKKLEPWQIRYLTAIEMAPLSYFDRDNVYYKRCVILEGGKVLCKFAHGWAELTVLDVLRPAAWLKAVNSGERFFVPIAEFKANIKVVIDENRIPLAAGYAMSAFNWLNKDIQSYLASLGAVVDKEIK